MQFCRIYLLSSLHCPINHVKGGWKKALSCDLCKVKTLYVYVCSTSTSNNYRLKKPKKDHKACYESFPPNEVVKSDGGNSPCLFNSFAYFTRLASIIIFASAYKRTSR